MTAYVAVPVRECPDGSHPEGDSVYLLPKLSLEGGIAARQDVDALRKSGLDGTAFEQALIRRWLVTFCRYGAVDWDLHESGGDALPFEVDDLLADHDLAYAVADRADDLYRESVMRPLLATARPTSPSGRTGGSTSAPTTSTGSQPEPSSPPASDGSPSEAPTP